jgi:hypothetical protein
VRSSLALGKTEIVFGPCLANALFKRGALERASQFRRQPNRHRRQGLPGRSLVESARSLCFPVALLAIRAFRCEFL